MSVNTVLLLFIVVLINFCLLSEVQSYNILGIFPFFARSHFKVFEAFFKGLAERGHNVTVISYFPQKEPIDNYHDINLGKDNRYFELRAPVIESKLFVLLALSFTQSFVGPLTCKMLLEDEEVQDLLETKQKFDLVVVEQFNTDCPLSLAYKLGAPVIGITANMLLPWHYTRYGVPYNPSYAPFDIFDASKPNFFQRVARTITFSYITFMQYVCTIADEMVVASFFDDVPPLNELIGHIKFLLLYQNFVVSGSQVLPSNIIEVGGFHVPKVKQLQDIKLKNFIDESKTGVIYVSFGSILSGSSMNKEKFQAILDALKELPYRIVWKWDKKIPNLPDHIYVSKWLPQNDILAHPNVIAFFSHCGQLSTTEAIHHGVPILGMPVLGDQYSNAAAIENKRIGVQISISDITKELLLEKFKIILDTKFRENVLEVSKMWRDRPVSAMNTAIYWAEYAVRYQNLTFRPPIADVPMYMYLGLDIIITLILLLIPFVFAIKYTNSLLLKQRMKSKKAKKT